MKTISNVALSLVAVAALFAGCRDNVESERVAWTSMGTIAALQTKGDRDGVKGEEAACDDDVRV